MNNALRELLMRKKEDILNLWREKILAAYAPDTATFFRQESDRFANPVGYSLRQVTVELFDRILGEEKLNDEGALQAWIKLRAVQDFSAAEASGFIFTLKDAVWETTESALQTQKIYLEFLGFTRQVDALALQAFDLYMQSREKIHEIRIKELNNRTPSFLERANLSP